MKLKFITLLLLFLTPFSFTLHAYYGNDNSEEMQSKEEYKATVEQIVEDLKVMRPSLLMNFCKILNMEEDGLNRTFFYYQQQYQSLASGFHHLTESDSNLIYIRETIEHNLEREQNTFGNATTYKTKNKCLNNLYTGLLGSSMMVNEILDGLNLKQLYKKSKKL